ncbi:MAG: DUF2029 domain-containing protein [Promethearchaeota archaeon]|nr:MAG: DUF2029 domain-containing protein [Candidatus Lokiarchaeota archaeon]
MKSNSDKIVWKFKSQFRVEILLIILGIAIRIFMLIYYYVIHSLEPGRSWGDVKYNYQDIRSIFTGEWNWYQLAYPPLMNFFLVFLRVASFEIFELYVFYAFLLELSVCVLFYFVLKRFEIPKKNLAYGLFLINPFVFLSYVFSASNCGYSITDSFFCLLLLLGLYFYPREDKSLFYFFMGLSMCAKWYTLPVAVYFFLKFSYNKDWIETKKVIIFIGIPILAFLILPIFYLPNYLDLYDHWFTLSQTFDITIPLYIKIIPISALFVIYLIFRLRKADLLEITFFSIALMFSFEVFAKAYVRYLTPLVFYGHLRTNEQIFIVDIGYKNNRMNFNIGNHMLTYFLSILACIAAILIILFLFNNPLF